MGSHRLDTYLRLHHKSVRLVYLWALVLGAVISTAAFPGTSSAQQTDSQVVSVYLRPGDVIRLTIWREPDLSGEFVVDERGEVVFPRLGTLAVTTVPVESLREKLKSAYEQYLDNPSIGIQFLWKIKVVGAVMKPGLYPVDPTTTITDAIAVAGGVSPLGRSDQVEIVRQGNRTKINLNDTHPLLDEPVKSGDEIIVPQRGWLSRNPTVLPISISALASLIAILSR